MTAAELLGKRACSGIEWKTIFNGGGRKKSSAWVAYFL